MIQNLHFWLLQSYCFLKCLFTLFAGSLKDRHIENESKLYAVFTPKENLRDSPHCPKPNDIKNEGPNTVTCHIMLKVMYSTEV